MFTTVVVYIIGGIFIPLAIVYGILALHTRSLKASGTYNTTTQAIHRGILIGMLIYPFVALGIQIFGFILFHSILRTD